MKTTKLFSALAAMSMLFACNPSDPDNPGKDNPKDGPEEPQKEKEATLTVNLSSDVINFVAKDEAVTFQVLGSYDWTITKSNLDWAEVSPASGTAEDLVTVTVTPQENSVTEAREGTFTIALTGKDVSRTIKVAQEAKGEVKPTVIAKWTWSALWDKEEPSAPTNKTNTLSEAGKAAAIAWETAPHEVPSDVVKGGTLGFFSTSATVAYSMGPATHKKNRFRATNLNKGDYYWFKIDNIDVKAGATIGFHNCCLQTANITKGPGDYAIEWSVDGTTWTKIKDIKLDASAANVPAPLDCTIQIPADYKGAAWLRIIIVGDKSADGTVDLAEGEKMLPMLTTNDACYPTTNSYDVRDAYYEDDWAFVYFDVVDAQ